MSQIQLIVLTTITAQQDTFEQRCIVCSASISNEKLNVELYGKIFISQKV